MRATTPGVLASSPPAGAPSASGRGPAPTGADIAAAVLQPLPALGPTASCEQARALLSEHADWPCLVVVGAGSVPIGLIGRGPFLAALSQPYGRALYANRPIAGLMDPAPLIVPAGLPLSDVALWIATRKPDALVDGFVIVEDGVYRGIGTGLSVLARDAELIKRQTREIDEARRAAEASNRAKSAFLANVNHEIRTPLNGILANLELLRLTDLGVDQRDLVESAGAAAAALLAVIGDVLDFSKIEAGHLAIDRTEIVIRDLMDEVAAALAAAARRNATRIVQEIDPDVPERVVLDGPHVRQVLLNLVGNAIKFTRDGTVLLAVGCERPARDPAAPMLLRFEVADTGVGFAPSRTEALFEAFVQDVNPAARQAGGTGLGLAISRRLVEGMGGAIGADSAPGEGASFWFTLPAAAADVPSTAPPPPGARLLVVGPSAVATDTAGATVLLRATSLDDARRQVVADSVDVALLDAALLDHSGIAADGIWRDVDQAPGRTVVHLAGTDSACRRRLLRRGFVEFVTGPLSDRMVARLLAPAAPQGAARGVPAASAVITQLKERCLRILVIEDDAFSQDVARRQLEHLGATVTLARDGKQGLAVATGEAFSIILCDVRLPEIDGHALTTRYRAWESLHRPGRRTPILMLTANAIEGERDRCLDAGADAFLTKPVGLADLAAVIEHATRGGGAATVRSGPGDPVAAPLRPEPVEVVALADRLGMHADDPDLRRVIDEFRRSASRRLADIDAAIAAGDRAGVEFAAHAAAGAALYVGGGVLGDLFRALERGAADDPWDRIEALRVEAGHRLLTVEQALNPE